jgi:hypothetical protein
VGDQLCAREAAEVEARHPREDRRRELVDLGGGEDEGDVLGRLLEGLQQGVEGRAGEHVHLVDDVDLAAGGLRQVADLVAEVANVLDAVVAGAVDLDHVDRAALGDRGALVAHVARVDRRAFDAHQALGEQARGGGLAEASPAAEEVRVMDPVVGDRVGQGAGDVLLTDQVREALRAVLACEDDVGHGSGTVARARPRFTGADGPRPAFARAAAAAWCRPGPCA